MDCSHFSTERVCFTDAGSNRFDLVAHYEYRLNAAGEAVVYKTRYTEVDGVTVVDTSGGTVTVGACPVVNAVQTDGQNYSEASIAPDYDPNGNGPIWAAPAGLQSFTVVVRKAGSLISSADRVRVDLPTGKYWLVEGDVRTWSVAQQASGDEELVGIVQVEAEGVSAFDVIWNVAV